MTHQDELWALVISIFLQLRPESPVRLEQLIVSCQISSCLLTLEWQTTFRWIEPGDLADISPIPIDLIPTLFPSQRVEDLAIVVDRSCTEWFIQSIKRAII
jgi:hypothetical protein